MSNDKFQGLCLIGSDGFKWMCGYFDEMPRETRDLLNNCRFNICVACFSDRGGGRFGIEYDIWLLRWFEDAILKRREPPPPDAYDMWRRQYGRQYGWHEPPRRRAPRVTGWQDWQDWPGF